MRNNSGTLLVTGGAGFIGSALVRFLIRSTMRRVIVLDKLTVCGNLASLAAVEDHPNYHFVEGDIRNRPLVESILQAHQPELVMHIAAQPHGDQPVTSPADFVDTNVTGTGVLLEAARCYWNSLPGIRKRSFRFHHVSTDEVYGDLDEDAPASTEHTRCAPISPYAASKAGADHLVEAWYRTYGLPTLITRCSNNYGPFQLPEKLVPLTILNALAGKPIPVHGRGEQMREWLYVEDHVRALCRVASQGRPGETYNIGANRSIKDLGLVRSICALLEEYAPNKPPGICRYEDLITFVADYPGPDRRYAIDSSKIRTQLRWTPVENPDSGLRQTIHWYLDNSGWVERARNEVPPAGLRRGHGS